MDEKLRKSTLYQPSIHCLRWSTMDPVTNIERAIMILRRCGITEKPPAVDELREAIKEIKTQRAKAAEEK